MKRAGKVLIVMTLIVIVSSTLYARDDYGDEPRGNVHLGFPLGVAVNPTAQYTNIGVGVVLGAGYNFTRRHAAVGEFMWNRLFATDAALDPLRSALQSQDLSGSSDLIALTGNYRFELRGRTFGTYFIGGGGWYYRSQNLSKQVTSGTSTTCSPTWLWWGFSCVSGMVTANQTIGGSSSSAFGGNGGIGFTARVGEAPYRVYVESRYHYAPTKNISTQLVSVSVGIRY